MLSQVNFKIFLRINLFSFQVKYQNIPMRMYQLRRSKSWRNERKGRTENNVKVVKFFFDEILV